MPKLPRINEAKRSQHWTIHCHNEMTSLALQELLETKHLYQKVSVDPKDITKSVLAATQFETDKDAYRLWLNKLDEHLDLVPGLDHRRGDAGAVPLSTLIIKNAKLYCPDCESREAFAPIWFTDSLNYSTRGGADGYPTNLYQVPEVGMLVIQFQCQICKGQPTVFLVERAGWDLKLHGRSPMETVEVAGYIPKPESRLYSDAIIAFNSGKVLAGLFYLRAFIENFARRVTGITDRIPGDALMETYKEGLPAPQRDWMPSLREVYEKLSIPIHAATDDASAFTDAKENIDQHFDFRRIHNIPETPPPTKKTSDK